MKTLHKWLNQEDVYQAMAQLLVRRINEMVTQDESEGKEPNLNSHIELQDYLAWAVEEVMDNDEIVMELGQAAYETSCKCTCHNLPHSGTGHCVVCKSLNN